MPGEFATFLKLHKAAGGRGGSASPPRSRPATTGALGTKREPSPRRPSYEELAALRRRMEREADAPRRAEELKQLARESAARLARVEHERAAIDSTRMRNMQNSVLDCQYKREMIRRMQTSMIRSQVPANGTCHKDLNIIRLGSNRILPLYQSERLILHMEQNGFRKPWPGHRRHRWRPRSPSTPMTDEVSRDERRILSPSWHSKQVQIGRALTSPKGGRDAGKDGSASPQRPSSPSDHGAAAGDGAGAHGGARTPPRSRASSSQSRVSSRGGGGGGTASFSRLPSSKLPGALGGKGSRSHAGSAGSLPSLRSSASLRGL